MPIRILTATSLIKNAKISGNINTMYQGLQYREVLFLDILQFYIANSGCQTLVCIWELGVDYDVVEFCEFSGL